MTDDMPESQDMNEANARPLVPSERAAAVGRSGLAGLTLAVLGAGFAWFAYIDAPITDGAMLLFTAAVTAGFLAVCAAIIGGGVAMSGRQAFGVRAGRAAVLLFLLELALMLTAATLTLNLKGTAADDADTQTAIRLSA
jgi:predicted acyltransferase